MMTDFVFFTSACPGIGKSTSARMTAQALSLSGSRVALVDACPAQQSQANFLAIATGRPAYSLYALPDDEGFIPQCHSLLYRLGGDFDAVIVDCDHANRREWDDPETFARAIMRPFVERYGARIVMSSPVGGYALEDTIALLDAIARPGQTMAIAQLTRSEESAARLEEMLAARTRDCVACRWDMAGMDMISGGSIGYPKGMEPEWLKRVAAFCAGD
jgi:hypothetical protein